MTEDEHYRHHQLLFVLIAVAAALQLVNVALITYLLVTR